MKLIKILLSSMFVFTAVIKSADVADNCGYRGHRYNGINVHYTVINEVGTVVEADETACEANWFSLKKAIKSNLTMRQRLIDSGERARLERVRLQKAAQELVGTKVQGE